MIEGSDAPVTSTLCRRSNTRECDFHQVKGECRSVSNHLNRHRRVNHEQHHRRVPLWRHSLHIEISTALDCGLQLQELSTPNWNRLFRIGGPSERHTRVLRRPACHLSRYRQQWSAGIATLLLQVRFANFLGRCCHSGDGLAQGRHSRRCVLASTASKHLVRLGPALGSNERKHCSFSSEPSTSGITLHSRGRCAIKPRSASEFGR